MIASDEGSVIETEKSSPLPSDEASAGYRGHVVALLGPTASGKTAAAIAAAERLPIEVVSADSRQIRRGMHIGTAAPSADERAAVPHHLVGCVEPDTPWTVVDFLHAARAAFDAIWARGQLPLLVGGTGQYVWALLEGWQVPEVPPDRELRAELQALADDEGAVALHGRLRALDPVSADRIDARNTRRVIRAIEIVSATGRPIEPLRREPPPWSWSAVGIRWERSALHQRADARAEEMYAAGLVGETRGLIQRYGSAIEPLRSMGYAEAARVVAGEWDEATALERTKHETHRLIRTQANWFRADDARIEWRDGAFPAALVAAVEAAAKAPVR